MDRNREEPAYSGEKARQGEIILRTKRRRAIFIAGLVGLVLAPFLIYAVWQLFGAV